jgi:hypothetical protein
MDETCGNCRFWVASRNEEGEGTCHRHAPRCVMSGQMTEDGIDTVWPWVAAEDWCGEWEASEGGNE